MSEKVARNWLLSQNKFQDDFLKQEKKLDRTYTISIASGKGGVGKSSIAIKMSKILSDRGYKVLLVDCDYNLSNTSIKLGIPLNNNFARLVSGEMNFDECLYKQGNFHLLPGCSGNMDIFSGNIKLEKFLIDLLLEREDEYDFILLDCPAGLSKEILTLNAYSDYRFIILNPDKSSLTDAYSLMKILKNNFGISENHILLNMMSSYTQYKRIVQVLSDTTKNFLDLRLQVLGHIFRETKNAEKFDGLLNDKGSGIHKNLSKILSEFTEKNIEEGRVKEELVRP
jgi:flagellar biosynthesis protein FlhG